MNKKVRICPKCGKQYNDAPAISRREGKEEICPDCGMMEALADMAAAAGCTAEEVGRSLEKAAIVMKNVDIGGVKCG